MSVTLSPRATQSSTSKLTLEQQLRKEDIVSSSSRTQSVNGSRLVSNALSGPSRKFISFSQSGFSLDRATVLTTQEKNRFIRANQDLLFVIDQSDAAKENLKKTKVSTRDDLIDVVAETAASMLSGGAEEHLTEDVLKEKPLIASMIVLDTASLRTNLNNNEDVARVVADSFDDPLPTFYEKLANIAVDKFSRDPSLGNSHNLNDASFFKENPKAAVFLLGNPDFTSRFVHPNDASSQGLTFKNEVKSQKYQDMFDAHTAARSDALVDLGAYSESFFNTVPNLSEYIAAGEFVNDIPTPADIMREDPSGGLANYATSDYFNEDELILEIVSRQANSLLDENNPMDVEALRSNQALTGLILVSPDFRSVANQSSVKDEMHMLISGDIGDRALSNDILNQLDAQIQTTLSNPRSVSIVI